VPNTCVIRLAASLALKSQGAMNAAEALKAGNHEALSRSRARAFWLVADGSNLSR
jgi:hypothetical protein